MGHKIARLDVMIYRSTRGVAEPVSLSEAIQRGLAPNGGLYQPSEVPRLEPAFWRSIPGRDHREIAAVLLEPFVDGELPDATWRRLVDDAFDFPIPLVRLVEHTSLLELFHGPTLAFKDIGARFLARLQAALGPTASVPSTVLVATSGDTGGAVAQAYHRLPGFRVVVLYPLERVSRRQESQFASLGDNVRAVAVEGSFDDCQRLAKAAFADPELAARLRLTSANSINIGRLLPQITYYAHAWSQLGDPECAPVFCTPSGNLGNLTAGLIARRMGLPCSGFIVATNANTVFPDYLASGLFTARPSLPTLAHAMDVGNPSNLERIRDLFGNDVQAMRSALWASSHADDEVRRTIAAVHQRTGTILDPHTAVGFLAVERYRREVARDRPVVLLATAHAAKFDDVVEPIVGSKLPVPPQLAACLDRPVVRQIIPPQSSALEPLLLAPWPAGF